VLTDGDVALPMCQLRLLLEPSFSLPSLLGKGWG